VEELGTRYGRGFLKGHMKMMLLVSFSIVTVIISVFLTGCLPR
jgi:hypothetical protein